MVNTCKAGLRVGGVSFCTLLLASCSYYVDAWFWLSSEGISSMQVANAVEGAGKLCGFSAKDEIITKDEAIHERPDEDYYLRTQLYREQAKQNDIYVFLEQGRQSGKFVLIYIQNFTRAFTPEAVESYRCIASYLKKSYRITMYPKRGTQEEKAIELVHRI